MFLISQVARSKTVFSPPKVKSLISQDGRDLRAEVISKRRRPGLAGGGARCWVPWEVAHQAPNLGVLPKDLAASGDLLHGVSAAAHL